MVEAHQVGAYACLHRIDAELARFCGSFVAKLVHMRFLRRLVQRRKPVQTKSDQRVRLAQFNVYDARRVFCGLVERARRGEEVVIARAGRPVAKIVPYAGEATRPGMVTVRVVLRDEPDRRTAI